jgi:hypothetical protein
MKPKAMLLVKAIRKDFSDLNANARNAGVE